MNKSGDLYVQLVLPTLNLSILDAATIKIATIKIDVILIEYGGLHHILPLTVHLKIFGWTSSGDHSIKMFFFSSFFAGHDHDGGGWWPTGF